MKLTIIVLIILIFANILKGQTNEIILNKSDEKSKIELIDSKNDAIHVSFQLNSFIKNEISINGNMYSTVSFDNSTKILKKGAPDLPKITTSVIIPNQDKMLLEIYDEHYTEYSNIEIAPSKGILYRNQKPSEIEYTFGEEYEENKFFPETMAHLRAPYILRDFRGQTIVFTPFQYNPVTKILRVYHDYKIRLINTNELGENIIESSLNNQNRNKLFENIYKSQFLNYSSTKYSPVSDEGNMLIICPETFLDEMQVFVDWKNQKGIPTEIVDVSEIGQSSSVIKQYVNNYYNDNGLTFLLLIGDYNYIPPMYKSGYSDPAYGHILGNDSYAEVIVGRFSAENVYHLNTQIERTMHYELELNEEDTWIESALGIASAEGAGGAGDDNESDKQHMNNIKNDLLHYGYASVSEQYDPGVMSSEILLEINEGKGLINYVGHGDVSIWVTSGFTSSHINNLTNEYQLPFIFDVACQNGNFYQKTCFAETFMRATNDGKPTGASAIIASTINQPWAPPMDGQDEMVDLLVESYDNNIKRSFGGITLNGCLHMNDEYGYSGYETTNTWTIFGDPSLAVRTKTPTPIEVKHIEDLFIEENLFSFTSDKEGLNACLSLNGEIISSISTLAGENVMVFDTLKIEGVARFVVSGYNIITYAADIDILPNSGPYIEFHDLAILDNDGNSNELADYGEDILLDFSIINNGFDPTTQVSSTLTSLDEYITIESEEFMYGSVSVDQVLNGSSFQVQIDDSIPDQHEAMMVLKLKDSEGREREEIVPLILNAPDLKIEINSIQIVDSDEQRLPHPGEDIALKVFCINKGNSAINNIPFIFSSQSSMIDIIDVALNDISFLAHDTIVVDVMCKISEEAEIGDYIPMNLSLTHQDYGYNLDYILKLDYLIEDWESGNMNSFDWSFDGDKGWEITTDTVIDGSFSAKSGNIGDYETSVLLLNMEVLKRDTLSFFVKVSSEKTWDNLKFYIGNSLKGNWSEELLWTEVKYEVEPGNVTFKWIYKKDGSTATGEDCAWIDRIILPKHIRTNTPPEIVSIPYKKAFVNHLYKYSISVIDEDVENNIVISCSDLPEWLSFEDNEDGTALISGIPSQSNDDTVFVKVFVDDENIATLVTQEFYITTDEVENSFPLLVSEIKPSVAVDSIYTQYLIFNDAENDMLEFECISKPNWMNFFVLDDSTAVLEGIAGTSDIGNEIIKVTAKDEFMLEPVIVEYNLKIDTYIGMETVVINEHEIKVFPNPASDILYVSIENNNFSNLKIVDLLGQIKYERTIVEKNPDETLLKLNLGAFKSGVYFLIIEGTESRFINTFIKE